VVAADAADGDDAPAGWKHRVRRTTREVLSERLVMGRREWRRFSAPRTEERELDADHDGDDFGEEGRCGGRYAAERSEFAQGQAFTGCAAQRSLTI
jgi:hypothetical protein